MIEVENLKKRYGKKNNAFIALKGVSFSVPEGKSVAIVGKSGSGKSTLMHAMSGLDAPTSGVVIIDGENILELTGRELDHFRARKIGFIFQSFFVQANETVEDNVGLPLEIADVPKQLRKKKIIAALASVDLSEKLHVRARDLSGGQKQRLAIARAIVNEPRVLFADEPTGNLDSTTGDKIEELLFSYSKENDATLVVVTHDDDLAKKCDIQIVIKDGQIIEMTEKKKGGTRA
ncbi:MAG TPA: ABC transporter ATP-binding protein [Candidatus Saccharimonadales bacterium]